MNIDLEQLERLCDKGYHVGCNCAACGYRRAKIMDAAPELIAAARENQRLRDLVRHQRMELHEAGLISDEEYAEIAADHGAVARLEAYDAHVEAARTLERVKPLLVAWAHQWYGKNGGMEYHDATLRLLQAIPAEWLTDEKGGGA